MEGKGTELLIITLDISWEAVVKCLEIKEAIIKAQRRMLNFNETLFSMGSWNMCFCSASSSLGRSQEYWVTQRGVGDLFSFTGLNAVTVCWKAASL